MTLKRRAFTLIELLLVIAIISVLVTMLFPALARIRNTARLTQSLSNLRQANTACTTYRADFKGYTPETMIWTRGTTPINPARPIDGFEQWCTWSFGGKNNDGAWAGNVWASRTSPAGTFDVEAADRPINSYLVDSVWPAPDSPAQLTRDDPARRQQCEPLRDPSDRASYQRNWNAANPTTEPGVSCYDDVGTSYQYQVHWFTRLAKDFPKPAKDNAEAKADRTYQFRRVYNFGTNRIAKSEVYAPARMVWLNDQYADVVANCNDPLIKIRNGFGDSNKSAMAFLDGHVAYHNVIPGALPESYTNSDYTMDFEDLRIPKE